MVSLDVDKVSLRLMLERDDRSAYVPLAIATILDKRPDGGLVLDPNFMPCSVSITAIPALKRFLGESAGLVAERARSLAQRIDAPGQQGVADVAEFMMRQLLNRTQPRLSHLARLGTLHPERLHEVLVALCGELMTFTDESRLPAGVSCLSPRTPAEQLRTDNVSAASVAEHCVVAASCLCPAHQAALWGHGRGGGRC